MAILYRAELRPGKLELLTAWLPARPWYRGPAAPDLRRVTSYRFDDPAGEVGIETFVVRAGDGSLLQIPLTYRGAPLDFGDEWLVGTMEHSVLGPRWVYDGCGDPVHAEALATAILTGGAQAEEFIEIDGRQERREPTTFVRGSGTLETDVPAVKTLARVDDEDPTVIVTDSVVLTVVRALDNATTDDAERLTLTGTWDGQSTPLTLAYAAV
jgi:hypothetical protein